MPKVVWRVSILARKTQPPEVADTMAIPSSRGSQLRGAVSRARTGQMTSAAFHRVAVLGLGLIGGSLLQAVRQAGLEVVGYDIDSATAAAASASGYPVAPTDAAAVHGADLVVLAMPLPEVAKDVASVAPHL